METGQEGVWDHDIIAMLVEGASDKEIATRLFLSERTVGRRIAVLMRSVGANTRFQAGYRLAAARQVPAQGNLEGRQTGRRARAAMTTN